MNESVRDDSTFEYDVCLSFAGEDRDYVKSVAQQLRSTGVRVFYDEYEQINLWGKDLYTHLDDIYQNSARYCILFISKHYANKVWTNHERRSAQARAIEENEEYILPARFDDTEVPGLRHSVGYIDLQQYTPEEFADIAVRKVGKRQRKNYLPPIPDRLLQHVAVETVEDIGSLFSHAHSAHQVLQRMTSEEQELIFAIFLNACPAELPDNIHINIDLLRRISGFAPSKIKRTLGKLRSLGIYCSTREGKDHQIDEDLGTSELIVLEWHDMSVENSANITVIVDAMIHGATDGYCEKHAMEALHRLDFGQLATTTKEEDIHQ